MLPLLFLATALLLAACCDSVIIVSSPPKTQWMILPKNQTSFVLLVSSSLVAVDPFAILALLVERRAAPRRVVQRPTTSGAKIVSHLGAGVKHFHATKRENDALC